MPFQLIGTSFDGTGLKSEAFLRQQRYESKCVSLSSSTVKDAGVGVQVSISKDAGVYKVQLKQSCTFEIHIIIAIVVHLLLLVIAGMVFTVAVAQLPGTKPVAVAQLPGTKPVAVAQLTVTQQVSGSWGAFFKNLLEPVDKSSSLGILVLAVVRLIDKEHSSTPKSYRPLEGAQRLVIMSWKEHRAPTLGTFRESTIKWNVVDYAFADEFTLGNLDELELSNYEGVKEFKSVNDKRIAELMSRYFASKCRSYTRFWTKLFFTLKGRYWPSEAPVDIVASNSKKFSFALLDKNVCDELARTMSLEATELIEAVGTPSINGAGNDAHTLSNNPRTQSSLPLALLASWRQNSSTQTDFERGDARTQTSSA